MSATLSDESNEVTYLIRFVSLISSENSDRETKIICICIRGIRSYPIRFHPIAGTTETGFCQLPCSPKTHQYKERTFAMRPTVRESAHGEGWDAWYIFRFALQHRKIRSFNFLRNVIIKLKDKHSNHESFGKTTNWMGAMVQSEWQNECYRLVSVRYHHLSTYYVPLLCNVYACTDWGDELASLNGCWTLQ
jgi:hypothetical protein